MKRKLNLKQKGARHAISIRCLNTSNQKQRKKEFSLFLPFHNFEFHPMHMYYLFQKFNMIFKYIRIKKCETSSREISPLKWSQEARRGRSQAGPGTQIKELSITDLKRRTIRNTSSVTGHSRRDVHAVLGKELTTPATQPKRDCHHASLMDSHSKHPFPTYQWEFRASWVTRT